MAMAPRDAEDPLLPTWAKCLRLFDQKDHDTTTGGLSVYLAEMFEGIVPVHNFRVAGRYGADIAFKQRGVETVCAIMEYKSDILVGNDELWPEAQAAEYGALLDLRQWAPVVCLGRALEIRIGILVPAAQRLSRDRTHFYVDILQPTRLLSLPQSGLPLIKLVFEWMRQPRNAPDGLVIEVKRQSHGSAEWAEGAVQRGLVLDVSGPVLRCRLTGTEYAIKVTQGEDTATTVQLARMLDSDGMLDWAVGASSDDSIKVIISKWVKPTELVTMDGVMRLVRALAVFWRSGLVHGDLRPVGWGGNVVFADGVPYFLDFEWSGRYRDAKHSDSEEVRAMLARTRQATFPREVNQDAFQEYLRDLRAVPLPADPIHLGHDVYCLVGWLRKHFMEHDDAKVLSKLACALMAAGAATDESAMEDKLQAVRTILGSTGAFVLECILVAPWFPPHFGDERVQRYETRRKRKVKRRRSPQGAADSTEDGPASDEPAAAVLAAGKAKTKAAGKAKA